MSAMRLFTLMTCLCLFAATGCKEEEPETPADQLRGLADEVDEVAEEADAAAQDVEEAAEEVEDAAREAESSLPGAGPVVGD